MAYYTRLAARNGAKQGGEPMYTPKKATPRKRGTTAGELKKKFAAQRAKASVFKGAMSPRKSWPGAKKGKKAGRVAKA